MRPTGHRTKRLDCVRLESFALRGCKILKKIYIWISVGADMNIWNSTLKWHMYAAAAQRDQIVIIIIIFIGNKRKRVVRKDTNFNFAPDFRLFSFFFSIFIRSHAAQLKWVGFLDTRDSRQRRRDKSFDWIEELKCARTRCEWRIFAQNEWHQNVKIFELILFVAINCFAEPINQQ